MAKDESLEIVNADYISVHNQFTIVDDWLRDRVYRLVVATREAHPEIKMLSKGLVTDEFAQALIGPMHHVTLVSNAQMGLLSQLIELGYPQAYCRTATVQQYIISGFVSDGIIGISLDDQDRDLLLTLKPRMTPAIAKRVIDEMIGKSELSETP